MTWHDQKQCDRGPNGFILAGDFTVAGYESMGWSTFTPASALAGGIIIGIAAALLVLLNGRIAGISGIVGGLLRPAPGDVAWRIAFITGLMAAPYIYGVFGKAPEPGFADGYPILVAAGLLVGVGTRYGGGCTSGHGVCGIARFSPRALCATLVFMAAGFTTVYAVRHVIGV
jgi:uncharacterized membrane protein YedE/YeeE